MTDAITLRPATSADRELLYRTYASTREEELAPVDWDEDTKAAFLEMQFDAQDRHYRDNYSDTSFDVILCGASPAGRLYVARWPEETRIVDIALLPEYRGRGIGGLLLEQLLAEARADAKSVSIHVEQTNPARRLYERLGFRPIGEQGVYVLMEWRPTTQENTAS